MNKESLSSIINNSKLDVEEKKIFLEVFKDLINTHENVIDDLKKQIINAYSSNNSETLKISNLLIDKEDLKLYKQLGFEIICENKMYEEIKGLKYYSTEFLKCKYSDLKKYCDNIYEGSCIDKNGKKKPVKYKFSYNLNPIQKEKILEKISNQYNIEFNIVFSPFSRRMVDIHLLEDIDVENIDLEIEKNNLGDILQLNKCLVWNIKAENLNQSKTFDYTNAYEDKLNYIHGFDYEQNKYISTDSEIVDIIKDEKNIKLITKETDIKFEVIKINEIDTSNIECFENTINIDPRLERLRTKSQIYNAINQYIPKQFKYCVIDILTNDNNCKEELKMYESIHKNYKNKEEFFIINNSKEIYIQFEKNRTAWFVEDFYNYLLDNLNYRYPEFKWIGVY